MVMPFARIVVSVCVCLSGLGVALCNGNPFSIVGYTHCPVCLCVCLAGLSLALSVINPSV